MPRPTSVTILALAVLCLSLFNLLGAVSGVQRYAFLSHLSLSLPLAYHLGSRAVWSVAFGALAAGLWWLKAWGRVGTLAAFTLYVAQSWFDRLMFSRTDYARVTEPFWLALTVIGLALVWGVLLWPKVRQSFSA
ncbi:MAG: hypothetical protein HW378_2428 [Anaerolineales bacterium]|jgi:hypothetical protein|nr:hypothetical protein [Anaerolineales bacterium]MBM2849634.1 hypothetical protein [Anaerolineales bacterium]